MTALFPMDGAMPIPIAAQIAAVERELGYRSRCYPRWVQEGRMKQYKPDAELAAMRAVLATLRGIDEAARRPDPLGEALNSGDGSYRP